MALPRHSRTPMMMTADEQKRAVAAADASPQIRHAVEGLFGVNWERLTFQKKLQLIHDFDQAGRIAGTLAGAARGIRDLEREALLRTGQLAAEDQLRMLEERLRVLDERNTELNALLDEKTTPKKTTRTPQQKAS